MYQEIGRCAWGTGKLGTAYIYLTGHTVAKTKDAAVLDLVRFAKCAEKQCIHAIMLEKFILDGMEVGVLEKVIKKKECDSTCIDKCMCDLCMCCNHCESKCTCPCAVHNGLSKLHI